MDNCPVLGDLSRQAVNLDSEKYRVMVVWDPFSSKDVGWLTVKKDVQVDFSKLQVRDVNLTALVRTSPVVVSPSLSAMMDISFQVNVETCKDTSCSTDMTNTSQEVICISDKSMENYPENPSMDFNGNIIDIKGEHGLVQNPFFRSLPTQDILPLASDQERQKKIHWKRRSGIRRQCPQCLLQVRHADFLSHLRSAHSLQTDNEEVCCDICGIPVSKYNLEFHKLTHVKIIPRQVTGSVAKLQCICGKQYSTEIGLNQHRKRYCGKQRLQTENEEVYCDICGIPVSKYNLDLHKMSTHGKIDPRQVTESVTKLKCICGKQYGTESGLNQHRSRYCGKQRTNFGLERVNEIRRNNSMVAQQVPLESLGRNSQKMCLDNGSVEERVDTTRESSLNVSSEKIMKDKVKFHINYQNSSYYVTRSKGHTMKRSLKKFSKEIAGKDLRFEFDGKALTGIEEVKDFDGLVIHASSR